LNNLEQREQAIGRLIAGQRPRLFAHVFEL